jgi:hypothetical protein
MKNRRDIKDRIDSFCLNTINAIGLLYKEKMFAHMMVLMYSAIDSMGLLITEPTANRATQESFKNWTQRYLIEKQSFDFRAEDFWAARCGVLHTFTTESDYSKGGKVKEIQYYSGDPYSMMSKLFKETTQILNAGKHVPVHIETLLNAFLDGIKEFKTDLYTKCQENERYVDRLNKIFQNYVLDSK